MSENGHSNGWSSGAPGSAPQGSLKTKISIKGGTAPFYTFKQELPPKSPMLGSVDLLAAYDLGTVYSRFCGHRKIREELSTFLPHIYGNFDFSDQQDTGSLKGLVEKPPITGKEINHLASSSMQGFKLSSGPVDERYRYLFEKRKDGGDAQIANMSIYQEERREGASNRYRASLDPLNQIRDFVSEEPERKRHKAEKKEKKKKKDKKKKDKKIDEKATCETSVGMEF